MPRGTGAAPAPATFEHETLPDATGRPDCFSCVHRAFLRLQILEYAFIEPETEAEQLGSHRHGANACRRPYVWADGSRNDQLERLLWGVSIGPKPSCLNLRHYPEKKTADPDRVVQRLHRRITLPHDCWQGRVPRISRTRQPITLHIFPAPLHPQQRKAGPRKFTEPRLHSHAPCKISQLA